MVFPLGGRLHMGAHEFREGGRGASGSWGTGIMGGTAMCAPVSIVGRKWRADQRGPVSLMAEVGIVKPLGGS